MMKKSVLAALKTATHSRSSSLYLVTPKNHVTFDIAQGKAATTTRVRSHHSSKSRSGSRKTITLAYGIKPESSKILS